MEKSVSVKANELFNLYYNIKHSASLITHRKRTVNCCKIHILEILKLNISSEITEYYTNVLYELSKYEY